MGLKDTLCHHVLSEQLPTLNFMGSVSLVLSASPGGIKDSNMMWLQSKVGHRETVITVALRRQDSGDSSSFVMPGSSIQPGSPDSL